MSPDKWKRVTEIVGAAWDCKPERLAAFLDRACGSDSETRAEVEALLGADRRSAGFLENPVLSLVEGESPKASVTDAGRLFFGTYRVLREIGSGGMGTVYLAERADGEYVKQVAIKVAGAHLGADLLRRFRNERQAEAAVDHPHIAKFLDGGTTPDGLPYIVMEYVDGVHIDEWCSARRLNVRDRIRLFGKVCAAVQSAHDRHVIHRDIKPANILVDSEGNPKLLDFGIAKILDPLLAQFSETTRGVGPMTIEYASPEQVRGEHVAPTSDVYSLGVLLYVLLARCSPYQNRGRSLPDMARAVCEEDPPKPSGAGPPEISRELAGDLDNIVLKALSKQPQRRYQSVAEFWNDLDRHLHDLPIRARPDRLTYRICKYTKRNRSAILPAILAVLVALAATAGLYWRRLHDTPKDRSLAVLPLENLSGDREQEYFADGITDTLIGELSRIQGLRVISRTSVMQYKNVHRPARDIARELRASTLVEGSVFRSGTRLRITTRLIDAANDRQTWNGNYEGEVADVIKLQREVAQAIAKEINLTLDAVGDRAIRNRRVDVSAYDSYSKGLYVYYNAFTRENMQKAMTLFRRSLELDPTYAPAYGGLATSYYAMSNIYSAPVEVMPKAKAAALKAIEIDETFAEAHGILALILSVFDFNRVEAEKQFQRALQLKPSNPDTHLWYAEHLVGLGRFDEAVAALSEAAKLDPASTGINAYFGLILFWAHRYDDILQRMGPIVDLHPEYHQSHAFLGLAYEMKHDYAKAITEMERAYALDKEPEALAQLGHIYAVAGEKAKARRVLAELKQLARRQYISTYNFAVLHAGLGERDEAFRYLETVLQDRSEWFAAVNVDPRLDLLHSDPRFAAVVRAVGLQ